MAVERGALEDDLVGDLLDGVQPVTIEIFLAYQVSPREPAGRRPRPMAHRWVFPLYGARVAPVNPIHHGTALFDVAVALTVQGIALADLTPSAFLHYAWECHQQGLVLGARGAGSRFPGHLAWRVLHEMEHFPSHGPATIKAALLTGKLTVEELVGRYTRAIVKTCGS